MSEKDLKINFRYLTGNIACMSVDSTSGKPVHNDINNEEAIILFNSLIGEKEGCMTLKTLLKENQQLKQKYENAVADYESEKSKNQRAINDIDLVIELIKQQPTEDDSWILGRLNGFKIILKGENNE